MPDPNLPEEINKNKATSPRFKPADPRECLSHLNEATSLSDSLSATLHRDGTIPAELHCLPATTRAKLHVLSELRTHPDILDEAIKLEASIPVWFGDHTISFDNGTLVVDIQSAWEPPSAQKLADEKTFATATSYPVEVNWRTRPEAPPEEHEFTFAAKTPEAHTHSLLPLPRKELQEMIFTASRPAGVDVGDVRFSKGFSTPDSLHLLLVTVSAKGDRSEELETWRKELEQKIEEAGIHAGIVVRVENVKQDSADTLRKFADQYGVIRDFEKLPDLGTLVHGVTRPAINSVDNKPLPELKVSDLTTMPMIGIDPAGIKDPEDAIYEEKLSNGNRLMVVAVCVNRRFKDGSPEAKYAEVAGESLYGRHSNIPLFPEEFSYNEFALVEGKPRYAIVTAMEITPDKQIVKQQMTIAQVVNHREFSFDEADRIVDGQDDPMRDKLVSMREMAELVSTRPFQDFGFTHDGDKNDGVMIVTNCAIASKYVFASEMQKTGYPILYHVHTGLSEDRIKEFLGELSDVGIKADESTFTDAVKFRQMIGELYNHGKPEMAHQIMDVAFEKGRFQQENWGHKYLKVDAYAPLKTRLFPGWVNQQQALAAVTGEPGFSKEEMNRMEVSANEGKRENEYKTAKLRVFEEVLAHREERGKVFEATVKKTYPDELWLNVPGYFRWGSVQFKHGSNGAEDFQSGDTVKVRMDGYDVRKDRFRFRLVK